MTSSWQLEVKINSKIILERKLNLCEVNLRYGRLVVFIGQDSAEVWGFRYGLTLGIGTPKIMAITGVFVRVACALKHSTSCDPQTPSMILNQIKHKQNHSHKKMGRDREFYERRQRTKQTDRQPRIVTDFMNWIPR